ncbi:MAG: hypothetical protein IJT01_03010 [Selenomonadaceae bacterium]|nr:hypothetical protein [Selenomonadaceae bacterium]
MKDVSLDKIVGIGLTITLLVSVVGGMLTGSTGHEMQASIAGGLLGFLRGVTLDRSQPQSPGETLGKIAATAAEAQKAVQAAENIKDIVKK